MCNEYLGQCALLLKQSVLMKFYDHCYRPLYTSSECVMATLFGWRDFICAARVQYVCQSNDPFMTTTWIIYLFRTIRSSRYILYVHVFLDFNTYAYVCQSNDPFMTTTWHLFDDISTANAYGIMDYMICVFYGF